MKKEIVVKMASKLKKASEEQKEFIINFMENNIPFSQDKFEGVDGSHSRTEKWKDLSDQLNSLGGAVKDHQKWKKFWTDQKSHIKEKEALLKASFERSGINGPQKMKPLTELEKRVLQLMVPALITGSDDVEELFTIEENLAEEFLDEEWQQQSSSTQVEILPPTEEVQDKAVQHQAVSAKQSRKRNSKNRLWAGRAVMRSEEWNLVEILLKKSIARCLGNR